MDWKRIGIETTQDAADLISSILLDAGASGVEIKGGEVPAPQSDEMAGKDTPFDTVVVRAYYDAAVAEDALAYINERIGALLRTAETNVGSLRILVKNVADMDWNASFKKHFTTFCAAGCIVIKPTWETYCAKKGEIVIEMDPGVAFGSGTHETTRMCLELACRYMQAEASVLDVGCGSGILGIAAAKLGAKRVLCLDNDPASVRVTKENAQRNDIGILEARQSDLLSDADNAQYDVVFANIIADAIIRLNRDVAPFMAPGAVYIVSGVIEERLGDVMASLTLNGFETIETLAMGEWRAIAARRDDAQVLCNK